jgi:hypothetical protein
VAGRGGQPAVRRHGHGVDGVPVRVEPDRRLAGRGLPDVDPAVPPGRREPPSVRTDRHGRRLPAAIVPDRIRRPDQLLPRRHVPDAEVRAAHRGDELLAVGREGVPGPVSHVVERERVELLPRFQVPDPERPVAGIVVRPGPGRDGRQPGVGGQAERVAQVVECRGRDPGAPDDGVSPGVDDRQRPVLPLLPRSGGVDHAAVRRQANVAARARERAESAFGFQFGHGLANGRRQDVHGEPVGPRVAGDRQAGPVRGQGEVVEAVRSRVLVAAPPHEGAGRQRLGRIGERGDEVGPVEQTDDRHAGPVRPPGGAVRARPAILSRDQFPAVDCVPDHAGGLVLCRHLRPVGGEADPGGRALPREESARPEPGDGPGRERVAEPVGRRPRLRDDRVRRPGRTGLGRQHGQ